MRVNRVPRNMFSKPFWPHVTRKTGEAEEQQRDAKEAAKKSDGAKTRSWAGATPLFGPSASKVTREVAPAHRRKVQRRVFWPRHHRRGREKGPEGGRSRQVPSDAKQPVLSKRKIHLEHQANDLLEDLARFIGTSAEDALNIVLRKMMANDTDFQRWRCQQAVPQEGSPAPVRPSVNAANREGA
jgi:hypothetical protein